MSRNVMFLIASFLYVALVIGLAEIIRRRAGLGVSFTRKVVHVGVGLWIVPTLLGFTDWRVAIVPPAVFVVLNTISLRLRLVAAMEEGPANLGTILFPVAFMLLIAVFWPLGRPDVIAGGILVLALGDAAAAGVGRRWGRRRVRIGRAHKTLEGSAAMVVVSALALGLSTAIFGGTGSPGVLVAVALLAGVLEALSPFGLDNLLVPVGTAGALYALG